MRNVYAVRFTAVEVELAVDLFEIVPADDIPLEVFGFFIGQSSDAGDAQAELVPYNVVRGHTTSGEGGAAATIRALNARSPAASFTAETNNTTAAKAGTEEVLHSDAFNVQVGEKLWLPEGGCWRVDQGQSRLVVRLAGKPTDKLTMSGTLLVREV
jgi:hypothetical protein